MNFIDAIYRFFDRKWLWWTLIVLVVADLVLSGLTWGRHRVVVVEGTAWAWVNAPSGAAGMVYSWDTAAPETVDWSPPPGMVLQPLDKVYVTFYAVYHRTRELGFTISGKQGTFSQHTRPWETPNNITIELGAAREGYDSVNATFVNTSNYFVVNRTSVVAIIMVPDPAVPAPD